MDGSHMHDERVMNIYVTIDLPDGIICKGKGRTIQEAYDDARNQIVIARTPKQGPGLWEMGK